MIIDATDFIEHHGVKGMKWGVRRSVGPDGRISSGGRARLENKRDRIQSKTAGDKKTYEAQRKRA